MRRDRIKIGLKVKITKLVDQRGMMVAEKHMKVRQVGRTGVILHHIPGSGGDAWLIDHENGDKGAYTYDEFNPVK